MRRIGLCSLALLLLLFSLFLIFNSNTSVLAHTKQIIDVVTPTPDANAILTEANDAESRAQDLNTVLATVLGLMTLVIAALAVFGFSSIRDINNIKKEMRGDLEQMQKTRKEMEDSLGKIRNTQKEIYDDFEDMRNTRKALVYISVGDHFLSKKAVQDAMLNYRKAASFSSKNYEINYLLGRIYSSNSDNNEAIAALTTATQVGPDNSEAWRELGLAYRRRGTQLNSSEDTKKAIHYLEKAVTLNPNDDDAYGIIGGYYRRQEEYKKALQNYEHAYTLKPSSSYAAGNIASLAWLLNDIPKAKQFFNETELLSQRLLASGRPEGYWNYYDLALSHLALGKPDAMELYQKALDNTDSPKKEAIKGVLDNLERLAQAQTPIPHIAQVIQLLKDAENS